ncbi:MAG: GIY-YIG nuclease family protein [Bacteroidia bacterium]|nr:GIY-YIG nuclease family protein [Bacteroidia bacterium]
MLKSEASGKHYYGYTQDLEERLIRHNENRERATKNRGPWKLIYREAFLSRSEAMHRERYFKTFAWRKWLR